MFFMKTINLHITLLVVLLVNSALSFAQDKSNFIRPPGDAIPGAVITEDELGYIWIKGQDGLYKYDGYNFNLTPYQSLLTNDLNSDKGLQLHTDSYGNLWLSSWAGDLIRIDNNGTSTSFKEKTNNAIINCISKIQKTLWFGSDQGIIFNYNHQNERIEKIIQLPKSKGQNQLIRSIVGVDSNTLWISTFSGNVYSLSTRTKTLAPLKLPELNLDQEVRLAADPEGYVWILTESRGLLKYHLETKNITHRYGAITGIGNTPKYAMFISILRDRLGIIWASTDGDGLYKINPIDNQVSIFKNNLRNSSSISDNTIVEVYEDKNQNIWAIDKNGTINILPKNNASINYFSGSEDNTPVKILSLVKSEFDKSLWLGTDGNGLNRVFANNTVLNYDNLKKGNNHFKGKFIHSLLEDDKGNIWIATYQNGLWVYNTKQDFFSKIKTRDSNGNEFVDIRHLFKDSKNRIWFSHNRTLYLYSSNKQIIASFNYKDYGLKGRFCLGMTEDENGTIWAGLSKGGLFKFQENENNLSQSSFTEKEYYIKKEGDISNYNIASIHPNFAGDLYINTAAGILIRFNLKNETFESISSREKLTNIDVSDVLIENPNSLWISSESGIHQYNVNNDSLKTYDITDGFQYNHFRKRSSFKDVNGVFYFGGEKGAHSFYPLGIIKNETQAKLYINAIEILNQPAQSILKNQIETRIENVDEIHLEADQSSFSFRFSAIDNVLNTNYIYAYRLKGFDKEWISPKHERVATYTNIPPGSYNFEVKASSKSGRWDIPPKSIAININAPWWFSGFAIFLYFIFSIILISGIVLWTRLKSKLKKEEWDHKKEKELYALKMNFFTKMSHEIQTPLTLILSPIDDMLSRASINGNQLLNQRLHIIKNNANRLSKIAMDLITIRNKELGKLKLLTTKNNLVDHIENIAVSFSEQARFKEINFVQEFSDEQIDFWYDKDKIEHTLYNLLSNAFKFTPKNGLIKLTVQFNNVEQNVEISISDSGPGIAKNELDAIFELFYQANLGLHKKGSGIGLALTKELISLHHGEINVTSTLDVGTTFNIVLSTDETIFSEEEKIKTESDVNGGELISDEGLSFSKNPSISDSNLAVLSHTLLIVEDNVEMQYFLHSSLSGIYNIVIAENGQEGIQKAIKYNPDLIISDIMMPIMDGIEMCKTLQAKKTTAHIPIIFLTAKNNASSKFLGLESGAIEYLNKPFNFNELLYKVKNIISSKEKLISKYKTEVLSSPKVDISKSKDLIFMENLTNELNINLDNPDFKLEDLSKTLNLSYSALYRKCHEITGKTLVEFTRNLKLKKAAYLIVKQGYNISEAAYNVGYKDAKYFTKCFKEEFKITPNNLKKDSKKIGIETVLIKYNLLFD